MTSVVMVLTNVKKPQRKKVNNMSVKSEIRIAACFYFI